MFTPTTDPNARVVEESPDSVIVEEPAESVPAEQPADEQPAEPTPEAPADSEASTEAPAESEASSGYTGGAEAPSISLPTQEEVEHAANSLQCGFHRAGCHSGCRFAAERRGLTI